MQRLLTTLLAAGLITSSPSSAMLGFGSRTNQIKCAEKEYSSEKLFELAKNGVVIVSSPQGKGSRFVVKHEEKKTLLITYSHVINKITIKMFQIISKAGRIKK